MRVEVLGGLERRRRWSQDDKVRIVEETLAPGAKVTEVARRNGIAASVVFTWRRQARTSRALRCHVLRRADRRAGGTGEDNRSHHPKRPPDRGCATGARTGLIEIDLGNRRRVRVDAQVDPGAGAGSRRAGAPMIAIPGNVRVWLATGHTDMRRGFPSLARLVQEDLNRDPHAGDLYVFRGRRSDLIKSHLARRPGRMPVHEAA